MLTIHNRPAADIYEAIHEANSNTGLYTATVISGNAIGEKALFADGAICWCSDDQGFLKAHENEVSDSAGCGILNIDGENIFVELLGNEKHAVVCGAGHLSLPIITITRMMGMYVTVIDDREEFCENARRQGANHVICKSFAEGMAEIEGNDDTFFIVVTRGHRYDKDCVAEALRKRHAYVGMIGSKRHAEFVRRSLQEEGLSDELIDSIYTPIGLSIGAETPEEIAVAIVAEIIQVKNRSRRNFGFSRELLKAILDDDREPMILATIVSRKGSAPRAAGSKMLVRKDGSILETVGGGSAEAEVIEYAKHLLREGITAAEVRHPGLAVSPEEDGMVCGGEIEVLLETV